MCLFFPIKDQGLQELNILDSFQNGPIGEVVF